MKRLRRIRRRMRGNWWLLLVSVLAFGMLGGTITFCLVGCGLNAEQAVAYAEYKQDYKEVEKRVLAYIEEIAEIKRQIKAGERPVAEGMAFLEKIYGDRDAAMAELESLAASIKELNDEKVPWWLYLIMFGEAVIGIGGARGWWKKGTVLDKVVSGVEKYDILDRLASAGGIEIRDVLNKASAKELEALRKNLTKGLKDSIKAEAISGGVEGALSVVVERVTG